MITNYNYNYSDIYTKVYTNHRLLYFKNPSTNKIISIETKNQNIYYFTKKLKSAIKRGYNTIILIKIYEDKETYELKTNIKLSNDLKESLRVLNNIMTNIGYPFLYKL